MAEKTRTERNTKPKEEETGILPILPVRDTVLFPHAVLPLTVGRESSVQLINSLGEAKTILVVAQREPPLDPPQPRDLYTVAALPALATADKQDTLETTDVRVRLEKINQHLAKELEVQQLRNKIQSEVQDRVQQTQREYYLREQMKAIQKELGEQDEGARDTEELRQKIDNAGMPDEVKKEALKELGRLARMSPMAADYSVTRNYVEWLAALPWAKTSGGEVGILKAKEILDTEHYDLKKVKDRIFDYLSVRRLKPGMKSPILCFVGPPGVGKTSLVKSMPLALRRNSVRISLAPSPHHS